MCSALLHWLCNRKSHDQHQVLRFTVSAALKVCVNINWWRSVHSFRCDTLYYVFENWLTFNLYTTLHFYDKAAVISFKNMPWRLMALVVPSKSFFPIVFPFHHPLQLFSRFHFGQTSSLSDLKSLITKVHCHRLIAIFPRV